MDKNDLAITLSLLAMLVVYAAAVLSARRD